MNDDAVLAELRRLRSDVAHLRRAQTASQTRHGWVKYIVKDLETNPHRQYTVHKWGAYYWLVNFAACSALFFFSPGVWLKWGLYITLMYSIYANFSTDYSGMSAAMAAYDDHPLPEIPMETR